MPEITGMFITTRKSNVNTMYVTEKTCKGVLKVKLTPFLSELDNKEDFYKIS